jgi:hypothetical protein
MSLNTWTIKELRLSKRLVSVLFNGQCVTITEPMIVRLWLTIYVMGDWSLHLILVSHYIPWFFFRWSVL